MFTHLPSGLATFSEEYLHDSQQQLTSLCPEKYQNAVALMLEHYPKEAKTETEQPLIIHLIESAKMVNNLDLHETSVLTTLFSYFPIYHPNDWRERLSTLLDTEISSLIVGLNQIQELTNFIKLATFTTSEEKNKQSETMRKMLLAMVNDIRIVLIKLCMVTENMRALNKAPQHVPKEAMAKETLDIFAPLANRLGIWQLKWQLEDLGFQHQSPKEYKNIAYLLNEKIDERLEYITNFTNILQTALEQEHIQCEVAGRPKHIYSIYRKMRKKNLEFKELYDIRAVRVLVETIPQCYHTLGIVHSLWKPISGEFDDYISNPKPNNYRSLHTVIIGPENKGVEVQIRTFEMHRFAEFGVAAHWKYKEGSKEDSGYEQKIAWLRQLLEWRENVSESDVDKSNLANAFRTELFNDTIYVLTPMGKVLSLPQGSTPIDFAYALHSDVGNRCRGAKVNGNIVPLSTPLENGQRVEIITSKEGHPSVNWLYEGWVKSHKAIAKIRSFIRKQNAESVKEIGKNYLEKELYKLERRPSFQDLANHLNYKTLDDLYISIGNGELTNKQLLKAIRTLNFQHNEEDTPNRPIIKTSKRRKVTHSGILINGESGLLSIIAKCCKPAPPDEIIGFVTRGRGISIHRQNCDSLKTLINQHPEKIISATWGNLSKEELFSVDIEILAQDRSGLLRDISDIFSRNKINVTGVQTHVGGITARMRFTVELRQVNDLDNVLSHLGNIRDVYEVHRI